MKWTYLLPLSLLITSCHASAAVLDLTSSTAGTISTNYGDALFTTNFVPQANWNSGGPFLVIQDTGVERGYNTSNPTGVFDTVGGTSYNRDLQLSNLTSVTINGASYYSFLLVLGEPGYAANITLDALQIYTSATGGKNTTDLASLGTKRFDLDSKSESSVLLRDTTGTSGAADVAFFIPTAAFAGVKATDYIYMYQQFSNANLDLAFAYGFGGEATFAAGAMPAVPELSMALPLTSALGAFLGISRLRRKAGSPS